MHLEGCNVHTNSSSWCTNLDNVVGAMVAVLGVLHELQQHNIILTGVAWSPQQLHHLPF